jgi:hypothetical protein
MSTVFARTRRNNQRRTLLEVERLEGRELLSAAPGALLSSGPAWVDVHHAQAQAVGLTADLFIDGTEMKFNEWGLPAYMAGNLFLGNDPSARPVGKYEEVLTPMLMNGQFVGTTGAATFTFFVAAWSQVVIQRIETTNVSLIQGVVPETGALIVASTGTVTGSSGIFKNLEGTFTSSSTVVLYPSFDSDTQVKFNMEFSFGQRGRAFFKWLAAAHKGSSPLKIQSGVDKGDPSTDDWSAPQKNGKGFGHLSGKGEGGDKTGWWGALKSSSAAPGFNDLVQQLAVALVESGGFKSWGK